VGQEEAHLKAQEGKGTILGLPHISKFNPA